MRKEPGPPSCSAWNNKKLGETIGADLDVFKLCSALCKGERATTTADFAKVKRGSKSLLGTIVSNKRGKLNLPARVNPQAQANKLWKQPLFYFNHHDDKTKCTLAGHVHEKNGYDIGPVNVNYKCQ